MTLPPTLYAASTRHWVTPTSNGRAMLHTRRAVAPAGNSPIAGDHREWDEIRNNFLTKLGPLSGGHRLRKGGSATT